MLHLVERGLGSKSLSGPEYFSKGVESDLVNKLLGFIRAVKVLSLEMDFTQWHKDWSQVYADRYFDRCEQSLKWLLPPAPIHPSIHLK